MKILIPNAKCKKILTGIMNWTLALTSPIWMGLIISWFACGMVYDWIRSKEQSDINERHGIVPIGLTSVFYKS